MTPTSMIPQLEPLPLAAPVWLLWGLLMLTFVLHVVAMNLLVGGSMIVAYARVRHAANVHARALVTSFVRIAPVLVAATVTFGVAPLLFLQVLYGRVFFVSSILMAWLWLGVVPAVIIIYYGAYVLSMRTGRATPPWLHIATAGLLAAVGFLYTTNMTLMLRADQFGALYAASGRGLHLNLGDPTLWPRWLHMMLGAIGVAGLAFAAFGVSRRSVQPDFARWACRFGAHVSVLATGLNVLTGLWWTFALPAPVLERFTAGGVGALLAGGAMVGGAALVLLVMLARRQTIALAAGSAVAMLVTVVAMVFTRDAVRSAALDRVGFAPATWVVSQLVPIAAFFALLIAALATVGWMIYTLHRAFVQTPAPIATLPEAFAVRRMR
jgi:hypothetical protein